MVRKIINNSEYSDLISGFINFVSLLFINSNKSKFCADMLIADKAKTLSFRKTCRSDETATVSLTLSYYYI